MKKALILTITLAITMQITATTYANPSESQVQSYNETITKDKRNLSVFEAEESQLVEEIQLIDNEIENAMYRQEIIDDQVDGISSILETSEENIKAKKEEIQKREEMRDIFVRNLYKTSKTSTIDLIFNSKGVMDFINNTYNVARFNSFNTKNIEDLNKAYEILELEQEELLDTRKELEDTKLQASATVDSMKILATEQQLKLETLKTLRSKLSDKIQKDEEKVQILLQEIEREKQEREAKKALEESTRNEVYATDSSSSINSIETGNEIIDYATTLLGIPYVWGGTTTDGFDCSGLVQYVYRNFGIETPRVSQDQQNFGQDVALSDLQAGDLIFYGNPATHVALYVKDNYILHAPNTGDVVKIQEVDLNRITSAKRIR